MQPHPEGGWFAETYRSDDRIPARALEGREYSGERAVSTGIYFLLEGGQFSAFHRIRSDEMWHFYEGSSVRVTCIRPDGALREHLLGRDFDAGERLQAVVPAFDWFASEVVSESGYALVGCTVAPGFDFEDFELAEKSRLSAEFPQHRHAISRLCAKRR